MLVNTAQPPVRYHRLFLSQKSKQSNCLSNICSYTAFMAKL